MKKIFFAILSFAFFVFIIGCSSNNDPQIRVKNNQVNKVNVEVQTTTDKKLTINDVEPGQTTEYQTVSEGNLVAVNVFQNESLSFVAEKNTNYTIVFATGQAPSYYTDK